MLNEWLYTSEAGVVNVDCRWSLGSVYNTRMSDSAQNLFISISKIDKRMKGSYEGKVDLKSLSVLHRSCLNQRTAIIIHHLSSPFKLADSEGVDT